MPYRLLYHPDVKKEDLPGLPENIKQRLRRAIEERLLKEPEKYSDPLKKGLKGFRKLRVGDYRIIFKVYKNDIIVLKIGHRKEVYSKVSKRKQETQQETF